MSFSLMDDDMDIVSKLGDEPNEDDGLTAAGLKAVFDSAGKLCKKALNKLISELHAATAAGNVGFQSSEDIDEDNVQAAIENVQGQLVDVSQGSVANGSITTEKLRDDAVTGAKIAADTLRVDVDGTDEMTVRRNQFDSVTNNLKVHYFRALGMAYIEGSVTVVPTHSDQSAAFYFNNYVPAYLEHISLSYLDTYNRTYAIAAISSPTLGEDRTPYLYVAVKNLSESSLNSPYTIQISGWYICAPETQEES